MSRAVSIRARRQMRGGGPPTGSLLAAFTRHLLVLAGAGVAGYVLASSIAISEQPAAWLIAGVVVGAAAALVARGWLGVLFLPVGAAIGVIGEHQQRIADAQALSAELGRGGILYLAALAAAVVAYLAVSGWLALAGRRGEGSRQTT